MEKQQEKNLINQQKFQEEAQMAMLHKAKREE